MDSYTAALDLLRRLPPTNVTSNLEIISRLCPDIAEDLAVSVDSPLQLKNDGEMGKEYLCCDYNRDGESYRYVINVNSIPSSYFDHRRRVHVCG